MNNVLAYRPSVTSFEAVLQFHRPKPFGVRRYYPLNPDAVKICEAIGVDYLREDKLDAIRTISGICVEVL